MRWNPHLTFNGQCEAAFKFYEKCLGGTIDMMMSYGDSPMAEQTPLDWHKQDPPCHVHPWRPDL